MEIDITPEIRAFRIFKRVKCFRFCDCVLDLPSQARTLVDLIANHHEKPIGCLPNHPHVERDNLEQNGQRFLILTDKAIYDVWSERVTRYCYSDMGWPSWEGKKSDLDRGGILQVSSVRGNEMQIPVNYCDSTGASIFSVWRYLIAICHRERLRRNQNGNAETQSSQREP